MSALTSTSIETPTPDTTAMRAVTQDRYGADPDAVLSIGIAPRPTVGDDEVLVRVAAAGVDMGTWHCMTGMPYLMRLAGFGVRSPKALNPGRAFAGTVEAVGGSVTSVAVGDEVYGSCDSSFADYASVPVGQLAAKPTNLTFVEAAAVPISASTALQAIRKAGVEAGQHVLVIGASGGVGSFAVQIAKSRGAIVTGVCSTAKVDMVRALGADHVIDYTSEDFADRWRQFDVVLDIGGARSLSDLRNALTADGTLVMIGGESSGRLLGAFGRTLRAVAMSPFVHQTLTMLASTEKAEDLDALRSLIESGQVTPAVDRTYPLTETAAALRQVRAGEVRGKVVVTI